MTGADSILLIGAILGLIAMLYSSVGQGGASGYIAVLALFSLAPEVIRPVALSLNGVVAGRAIYRFAKAGFIDWRVVVPIGVASMPLAFIGGGTVLPPEPYRPLLGSLLILSAVYLAWQTTKASNAFSNVDLNIPRFGGFASGGAIGFASGLSGSSSRALE